MSQTFNYEISRKSRFRNGSNARLLSGLFIETRPHTQTCLPLYSLRDWDHDHPNGELYPSLYFLYMLENDPTEYNFAAKYLEGWEHWQMLCSANFFKPYIKRWREELRLKTKASALKRLFEVANDPSSKNYTEVNKFLVQHGYLDKAEKGRPSKAQIKQAAREEAETTFKLNEDYDRIFGVLRTSDDLRFKNN